MNDDDWGVWHPAVDCWVRSVDPTRWTPDPDEAMAHDPTTIGYLADRIGAQSRMLPSDEARAVMSELLDDLVGAVVAYGWTTVSMPGPPRRTHTVGLATELVVDGLEPARATELFTQWSERDRDDVERATLVPFRPGLGGLPWAGYLRRRLGLTIEVSVAAIPVPDAD